jgi:hypothetical protein
MEEIHNRGTGAGGANTNANGKTFEKKTENESRLLSAGFIRKNIPGCRGKNDYYLEKSISPEISIVYLTQGGLKSYFAQTFSKQMIRCPDEAYLIRNGNTYILKVLEKKNQNVEGSVADKLQIGDYMKYEYSACIGDSFQVDYAFCISDFLKKLYTSNAEKYNILRAYNAKNGVTVLFGDDEDYYSKLDAWINLQ